jgi:pimeloyl-ACP methyl ester carboxylesterase
MSQTAISRIWRAFGLKPHLTETWKLSTDPQFIDKVRDIVSNLAADRFPFEQIAVPTLVINARDDNTFAPYRSAASAAARIPGAKLISIQSGGHWFLGHATEVREAIGAFVREVT